ncbi:MAG: hypothetical protein H6646_03315 [Anaerolineales bacterium]|nr:hypothetical protein [Anaerolineales bacterium]
MPARQLLGPRGGSIAEDEVAALIRRIAFSSRPLAPDDIGADFVCAVAHRRMAGKNPDRQVPMVYAGGWFLLSVKSGSAKVGLERSSGHFEWFERLEIPFLIAQVEDDQESRVTIFHTLQHIALIHNLDDSVETIEFRCEASPKYKPRNFNIDHSDLIEIDGSKAIAWLGPPLLELTRPALTAGDLGEKATYLLQKVCDFHTDTRQLALYGMTTNMLWNTNDVLDWIARGTDLTGVAHMTAKSMAEVQYVISSDPRWRVPEIWERSKPLFRFLAALRKGPNITEAEVFTDSGDRLLWPEDASY